MITFHLEDKSPLGQDKLAAIAKAISDTIAVKKELIIGISFVDSKAMQKLNAKYANTDAATDVLSFDYSDDKNSSSDGDIVVCLEIAKQQAIDNKISQDAELSLLIAHGTLHILGFDHQNSAQVTSLDALQSDIMNKLNYEYRDFKWSH